MNTVQALQAILEGKKIRHSQWEGGRYLHNVNGTFCNEKGYPNPLRTFHDNWEIYIEDTRKELPKGLIHTKDLYNLINSSGFRWCVDVQCYNCPYRGNIKENSCDLMEIQHWMADINKNYKLGELK